MNEYHVELLPADLCPRVAPPEHSACSQYTAGGWYALQVQPSELPAVASQVSDHDLEQTLCGYSSR